MSYYILQNIRFVIDDVPFVLLSFAVVINSIAIIFIALARRRETKELRNILESFAKSINELEIR